MYHFYQIDAFKWSGASQSVFGSSPTKGQGHYEEGGDDDQVPENPDIHFEPIISLPELVDHKTGEEEDEKIFSHRSKLYRYDNTSSQWKERGIGDMKILRNRSTGDILKKN